MHVVEYTIRVEPVELGYTRLISDNYLPGVTYISVGTVFCRTGLRIEHMGYTVVSDVSFITHQVRRESQNHLSVSLVNTYLAQQCQEQSL